MNLMIESIRARKSIRAYDAAPLSSSDRDALLKAFDGCAPGPFGARPRFALIEPAALGPDGRIGTYGVIRGAPAYLAGSIVPGPDAFVDFGYCMEGVMLAATALGLGTCWLGGLFNRKDAIRALRADPSELVPAVSPVGHPAPGKAHALDRVIRGAAGSSTRKPFDSMFFEGSFESPLAPGRAGLWAEVLESVRIGPSASNKQPWRILRSGSVGGDAFHLFLDEDRQYSRAIPGILLQDLDAGIAMRHFEAAARALGLPGAWAREVEHPIAHRESFKYIATWA